MSGKVNCDRCSKEFEIQIFVERHSHGIEEAAFHCTHCGHKYTAFYTDEDVRKLQAQARAMQPFESKQDIKRFDKLKEHIGRLMDALKVRMQEGSRGE